MYDILIIGAGPAGLTASIYASRYKLKNLVVGKLPGGLTTEAYRIENYPGFKSISGRELSQLLLDHARSFGAEIREGRSVISVKKRKNGFEITTDWKEKFQGRTLILAYGTKRRELNIPGEKEYLGKGVSVCATCDAMFFKDKTVAVIGGSDSAVMGAIQLAEFAKKVYIVYRRNKLRGEPIWVERVLKNPKIEVIYNTNITEIKGDNLVSSVILDNPYNGKKVLPVDGVFIEIGFEPDTTLARQLGVITDEKGFIKINPDCSTNIEGVYAAGDITNGSNGLRQIVTAAAEAAIAVNSIYFYLKKKPK